MIISEIIFGLFGMIIVSYFSRVREFSADKSATEIVPKEYMISALERLQECLEYNNNFKQQDNLKCMQISSHKKGLFLNLFRSHPSLNDRIRKLKK